jgi:hypothetical protein
MLPADGCVTPNAKPTATAASTALPPRFRIATPTSLAAASALLTAPCRPTATPGSALLGGSASGAAVAGASAGAASVAGLAAVLGPGLGALGF